MLIYKATWTDAVKPDVWAHEGDLDYMVKCRMFTQEQVAGMNPGDTIELPWEPMYPGKSDYHTVRVTMAESESYFCNCCKKEQAGDGLYTICKNCGWENEPGEDKYPDEDGGCNHMSLNEGRANFAQYGHYKCKVGCGHAVCWCE